VSFYFIRTGTGEPLHAVVEVNTFRELKPWLIESPERPGLFRIRAPKHFYVSPFSSLTTEFEFRVQIPDEKLVIHINDFEGGDALLTSWMHGERRALTNAGFFGMPFAFRSSPCKSSSRSIGRPSCSGQKACLPENRRSPTAAGSAWATSFSPQTNATMNTASEVGCRHPHRSLRYDPTLLVSLASGVKCSERFSQGRLRQWSFPTELAVISEMERVGRWQSSRFAGRICFRRCVLFGGVGMGKAYVGQRIGISPARPARGDRVVCRQRSSATNSARDRRIACRSSASSSR